MTANGSEPATGPPRPWRYLPTGIAGAAGFVGAYLSRYLIAADHGPLRLFTRTALPEAAPAGADVLTGDLMSRSDCERFAEGLSVIYYLAHNNTPVDSDLDLPSDVLVNLVPLLNLLQAIRELGSKPHVVYFSSGGAIYGPKPDRIPYRETDRPSPCSSYGIQKIAAEEYLRLAAQKGELTATILRVGNAYGTLLSQYRMQGLIGVGINCVAHGQPVRLFGNPNNIRDYVHLEDVSRMAAEARVPRQSFDVVNVGSGEGHSVFEVLRLIEECYGKPIQVQTDASQGASLGEWVVLDIRKAREEFGWSPRIDLRSGIERMLTGRGVLDVEQAGRG